MNRNKNMEQGITLEQVQKAMTHLREEGERVSRRNVRALTSGGMTTVHRLMGMVEKEESLQNRFASKEISDAFITAFRLEISLQTKAITEKFELQIQTLNNHEQELVDALAESESRSEALFNEFKSHKSASTKERQSTEKNLAVAKESIRMLEARISDYLAERKETDMKIDDIRTDNISKQCQIKALEKALEEQEKTIATLSSDLHWARNKLNSL
jgi:chromosome segregation ATPase